MKKLLLAFLLLPVGAMAQLTFDPFVSFGYMKEAPNVKNSRATRDYEGNTSYEGAPRLVYLSDISEVRSMGMYVGGGAALGIKNFPLALNVEIAGEHFGMSYHQRTMQRYRTENDFKTNEANVHLGLRYFRFTPSLQYRKALRSGISLQAQGGVSLMVHDERSIPYNKADMTNKYASINAGAGIGYKGVNLVLQANFGTTNMFRRESGFDLYSQRFTAGIQIYPKQFATMFK